MCFVNTSFYVCNLIGGGKVFSFYFLFFSYMCLIYRLCDADHINRLWMPLVDTNGINHPTNTDQKSGGSLPVVLMTLCNSYAKQCLKAVSYLRGQLLQRTQAPQKFYCISCDSIESRLQFSIVLCRLKVV